ncbi:MAG TPA: argininosuccinate synthase domain-containing protein [Streptosporangiaceae bacterium]|nr:argininosuccinate synthase domain-containing protein [Streptosporangiaceae bacterium]
MTTPMQTVLLWYDDFHTPLGALRAILGDATLLLSVDLGAGTPVPPSPGFGVQEVDAVSEFAEEYLLRAVRANALYQGGYHLSAALSRPLLAQVCCRTAAAAGARRLVHGLTGNDQLRLEMALHALAPDLEVASVVSLLDGQHSRNRGKYTISDNLWGRSVEAGPLADPGAPAPADVLGRCAAPLSVTPAPQAHTVSFAAGAPVAVDGTRYRMADLIGHLNQLAAPFGIGMTDLVEDGFVGLKTRAVYEAPAAAVLTTAHADLQRFVCSRRQADAAALVGKAWVDLVYDGFWFDPARASLEAFLDDVNQWVNGEVDLVFANGSARPIARRSPHALYAAADAVYQVGHDPAAGSMSPAARALSAPMRAAMNRTRQNRPLESEEV